MKLLPRVLFSLTVFFGYQTASAQCATASLNWDALEYLPTTGYSNAVATALSPNQNFAFGKNRLTVSYPSGITSAGETTTHAGETNAYGTGADIEYTGTGTITLTFATEVTGVKFSVFDIDDDERLILGATNSSGTPSITVTPLITPHNMTITGNPGTAPTIQDVKYTSGGQTNGSNTDATSSINVDIAGSVKTITLTFSSLNNNKNFWLSDISACVTGSFPTSYYAVSRPFGTMPSYVLMAISKSVYMVDPATGNAKFIFSDGATSGTINSLAYDPYNRIIYYCWSLTNNGSANASERTLRKYDMTTGNATTLLNDITSLGIPTFDQGVESGAAAFYDSALYLGIEGGAERVGNNPHTNTNKESIIWRLDFTAGVPTSATQVYAVSGDTRDWSDFSINDGVLYDANGDAATPDYHHLTLQTGANLLVPYVTTLPKQTAVGWNGTIYYASSTIGVYNGAGGVGTQVAVTSTPALPNFGNTGAPSFGDAAEAFRPQADFGDAPATYDPNALAPAVHEVISTLKIGSNEDVEWTKPTALGANADADGSDEDGLTFPRILVSGSNYQTDVNVFNNTGADATLVAWVDFNNNGTFEASEGTTPQTVATGTTSQTKSLYWTGITSNLPANSNTYLRIRITSATNGMTTAGATGYFSNGEVEDHYIPVNSSTLAVSITNFSARKTGNGTVNVSWNTTGEEANTIYQLERSKDGQTWTVINKQTAAHTGNAGYTFTDAHPVQPVSYYRLKYSAASGNVRYSNVEKLTFSITHAVQVYPNPAAGRVTVAIAAAKQDKANIVLNDISGRTVLTTVQTVKKGMNTFVVPVPDAVPAGFYTVTITVSGAVYTQKLFIKNQ